MTNEIKNIKISDLKKFESKSKVISIRTTEKISKWMSKNKISPTKLFNEAAEVIMKHNETSDSSPSE
jgi:hypothetical protein